MVLEEVNKEEFLSRKRFSTVQQILENIRKKFLKLIIKTNNNKRSSRLDGNDSISPLLPRYFENPFHFGAMLNGYRCYDWNSKMAGGRIV